MTTIEPFFFIGGIGAGIVGALLGLGGGIFLIPFLVIIFNVPMHQAVATSIIAVIATSSTGAIMNLERKIVNVKLGMLLELGTVAGAILGGITANYLNATTLKKIFSLLLFFTAIVMIYRIKKSMTNERKINNSKFFSGSVIDDIKKEMISYKIKNLPITMFISFIAGNVSGLLGVGGGIIKVPAMNILSGVPIKVATATSNFMIGVTAAASAFIYFAHGHINPYIISFTTIGVIFGSFIGIKLNRIIHNRFLILIFIVVLFFVSIRLFIQ